MRVTRFNGARDNSVGNTHTVAGFGQLLEVIAPAYPGHLLCGEDTKENKLNTPAWSPAEYRVGARERAKINVLRVHAFVIDLDGATKAQREEIARRVGKNVDQLTYEDLDPVCTANAQKILGRLQNERLAFIMHTSWSHNTEHKPTALRFAVKLSRAVEMQEWAKFWRNATAHFDNLNDPATKDASRLFFVAARPSDSDESQHTIHSADGQALDVDAILAAGASRPELDPEILAALGAAPEPGTKGREVPLEEITEFIHDQARARGAGKNVVGKKLKKMLQGERFAQPGAADELGGIDSAIFRMCATLTEQFPDADMSKIAQMFERSLSIQFEADGEGHTVEQVQEKLERLQEKVLSDRAQANQVVLAARAVRIREAFGTDRVDGYRPEELSSFGDMTHRWIIQFGSSYYTFVDGDYRPPISEKALVPAVVRDLAPAHTAGVEVSIITEDGKVIPKTPQELVLEYGSVATDVHVDLSAERSAYDMRHQVFIEATAQRRIHDAVFIPEVAGWLDVIGSAELKQWIALVTRVERPCAALYLEGGGGTGKSLLGHGLSRLWTRSGPTQAVHVLGAMWNDDLTKCPLVSADESLPPAIRAAGYTGDLRQAIQDTRRPLTRRYRPNCTMIGAIRLILAANNASLLETDEALTPADIEAIGERFLYVKIPERARAYLDSIGGRPVVNRIFIEEDGLAKHALWLKENQPTPDLGRFFFEGGSSEIVRALTTSSGIRGNICGWLVQCVRNPMPIAQLQADSAESTGPLVFFADERMYVAPEALSQHWGAYKTSKQPPTPQQAGITLRNLQNGSVERHAGGRSTTYYSIDPANLETWAEESGFCTRAQVRDALKTACAQASDTENSLMTMMPGANA